MEKDIGLIGMFLICRVFILYYYVKFVNIVELVCYFEFLRVWNEKYFLDSGDLICMIVNWFDKIYL